MSVEYDPFAPEVLSDPLPIYQRMREEAPVYFIERFDCHALTRFEDIWATARNWQTFSAERGTTSAQLLTRQMGPYPALGNLDPPRQKERRKLINPFLSPGTVRTLEPSLRKVAKRSIAPLLERGEIDVVTEYAAQIAIQGLCLSASLPTEDAELLRGWVNAISSREPDGSGLSADGVAAYAQLADYSTELVRVARRAATDRGSLIDTLIRARVEGERRLEDDEIAGHLREFIIGGAETFQKSFAACVHRLWQHPDQRAAVCQDPDLARAAFLEALRFDTPGQFMGRIALDDSEIAGVPIRKGQVVLLIWPSGNRDPREFEDPDRFDIHRRSSRMLAFGAGVHDCVGRHLALAEASAGLTTLLESVPHYEIDLERTSRLRSEFVQGFTTLPIQLP